MNVTDLHCEYFTNPLGIGVARPRLGWKLQSERRGAKQTAYRVIVSADEALAEGELWDSGKVLSDESVHVEYDGATLGSGQRAWWQVSVWDEDDNASEYSEPAWWEMGLLERDAWRGEWIGSALAGGPVTTMPCPYLRTTFALEKPVASARLYATALGLYECHLNGERVGDDCFTPGWTDYHTRVQYQSYDVMALLKAGNNALGAILGDGWYCGYMGNTRRRQHYGEQAQFLAQLVVRFEDGSTQTVATDGSWRTQHGPILESDNMMGETYDARREMPGWSTSDFDASRWSAVTTFPDPGIELSAPLGPAVQRIQEIASIKITEQHRHRQSRAHLFDLGQNMVGRVRLKIHGPAGATVTLRHAEILDANGRIYTTNLRTAKQTVNYTLKGDGEEIYEPTFTFHGFRYVEMTVNLPPTSDHSLASDDLMAAPTLETITGIVLHSATPPTGSFECSDPLINQLQHNIEWGQRGNFLEVPTDCPQRDERLGWTGDAQVFARTAAFNMQVAGFFTKWTRDLRDSQSANGAIPSVVPNTEAAGSDGGPAWADAEIICPWTIYLCYGDKRLLAEHYDSMAAYVQYLQDTSPGLIRCHPDAGKHCFGDWLAIDGSNQTVGGTPFDLIGTAFFAYSARLLGHIAEVLEKQDDAQKYSQLFEDVKTAFQRRFVTEDGLIVGQTQTARVLALHFDLLPEALRSAVAAELVRDIRGRRTRLSTGFVGSPYLPFVLSENGHLGVAYDLLHQKAWPSWLYAVTQGATTIWERWDGWTHDKGFQDAGMNSFNHYAYGAIGAWLYAVVAGLDLDARQPGYKHLVLHPRPGGEITSARATLDSVYGRIESDWRQQDGRFEWDIVVPPNTTATVYVPAPEGATITESDQAAESAMGVKSLRCENGATVFEVTAGKYSFAASGGFVN